MSAILNLLDALDRANRVVNEDKLDRIAIDYINSLTAAARSEYFEMQAALKDGDDDLCECTHSRHCHQFFEDHDKCSLCECEYFKLKEEKANPV